MFFVSLIKEKESKMKLVIQEFDKDTYVDISTESPTCQNCKQASKVVMVLAIDCTTLNKPYFYCEQCHEIVK